MLSIHYLCKIILEVEYNLVRNGDTDEEVVSVGKSFALDVVLSNILDERICCVLRRSLGISKGNSVIGNNLHYIPM